MTEGTSQGLFIVVAIVIFGIFVSLSYTLFGKTLQPSLVGLFEQAAYEQVYKVTDETYFDFDKETGTIKGFSEKGHLEKPKDLVIPEQIDGIDVNSIGVAAFDAYSATGPPAIDYQIQSVVLPPLLTKIEKDAFSNNRISSLILPKNLTYIGDYAFDRSTLKHLVIPDKVIFIGTEAFYSNPLESLTLSKSLKSVGVSAFYRNNLSELTIPKSLKTIKVNSFKGFKPTQVTIPNIYTDWVSGIDVDINSFHEDAKFIVK